MEGKTVRETSVMMAEVMLPEDANPAGNVHGGVIMKHIDTTAYVVACRHARCNVVTASVDRLDFLKPVFVGDLLILKGSMNFAGKSSMAQSIRICHFGSSFTVSINVTLPVQRSPSNAIAD